MSGETNQYKTVCLNPEEKLFSQGDASRDLFIVKSGKLRVFKSESGTEIDFALMGPGAVVGEMAAIDGGPRSASCAAVEKSELMVVPVAEFKRIMTAIPEWFRKIASILVQRLRDADAKIPADISRGSPERVAWLLAHMNYSSLVQGNLETGRKVSRQVLENELMDVLNVRIADVSAALASLHKQGLIELGLDSVTLWDIKGLETAGNALFVSDK